MPEQDIGDRTEEATPRKLREAREKGRVARSVDLSSALVLLGGVLVLKLWGHYTLDALFRFTRGALGNMDARSMSVSDVAAWMGSGGLFMLKAAAPIIGGLIVIAFVGNILQTGFIFSGAPLEFRSDRINPVEGMKRLMSKRGLVRLMASLFKVAVVALVAYFTIRSRFGAYPELINAGMPEILAFIMRCTFVLALRIGIALLALALLDFAYQKWQYRQDMRMTKQEVREELKRMEGDPLTRDRRRRMQRQIAMQRMMHAVPNADVVVTNPTEIAVALWYDSKRMSTPSVVAKGKRLIAQRMRELAEDHDVPIVERKALAQALYRMCDVGDQIPVDLHQAVAEVLAFVHEMSRMKARRKTAVA